MKDNNTSTVTTASYMDTTLNVKDSLKTPISMRRRAGQYVDWTVIALSLGLCAAGLLSIYSATFNAGMPTYFYKQLVFAGVGLVLAVALMFLPSQWIQVTSTVWYVLTVGLLVAVLFVGKAVNGQKNWLSFGGLSIQPSELAKLGVLIAVARFVMRTNVNLQTLRDLSVVMALIALPVALIILEPDYGSATVFVALFAGIALWAGADAMLLFACITPPVMAIVTLFGMLSGYGLTPMAIALAVIAVCTVLFRRGVVLTLLVIALNAGVGYAMPWVYKHVLPAHHKSRIEVLLNPDRDPRGQGYNVVQSKMAVGSGGIWGKGFQQGTQTQLRYIPKQWTDFIYCVPTEEFGFVGGSLVIAMLCGLCMRVVRVASLMRSKFESTIAIGIASLWFYHGAVNIGMAIGLLPVIGIPLPFMSAGGTSLLINMVMVGIVLSFYRQHRKRLDYSGEE
jgi:rod shape determining protein RodA